MNDGLLENTETRFLAIVERFGGDEKEDLARWLRSLLHRHQMDIRNQLSRSFSDFEIAINKLQELAK